MTPQSESQPPLTGGLSGLEMLATEHLDAYRGAVEAGKQRGFAYYFPYLLSRSRPRRKTVLIGWDEGSACIYEWRKRQESEPRLDLVLAPAPMSSAVLQRCLERVNDFNRDRSGRVLRMDAKDVERVAELPGLHLKERKQQYLYAPEAFKDIGGRRYRTLRRNVARIQDRAGVETRPYEPEDEAACRDLLRRWGDQHRELHGSVGGVRSTSRALDLAGTLPARDLRGEVILVDGRVCAFGFGGEIRPGLGCFLEAKSEAGVAGLSYFQRYSFLSKMDDCEVVNDGSDVGRAGLKQLKDSLRPADLHSEYRASQASKRMQEATNEGAP